MNSCNSFMYSELCDSARLDADLEHDHARLHLPMFIHDYALREIFIVHRH